eukprot:352931_1
MAQCGTCDIKTCSIFKRHYRDHDQTQSIHTDNRGYQKYSDIKCIGNLQIMDKIHCFYSHCHDIGNKLLIRERMDIEQKDEKQDDHEENDDVHFINELIAKRSQLLSTKRKMHEKYIGSRKRFCNKFNQLSVDIEPVIDEADKKDKMYCFGSEFVYNYEDEYIFNHDDYTAIQQTYDSLREELTQNTIATLSKHQFQITYQKANIHSNTFYCRSHFQDMRIQHLLALMIYCNYDFLQAQFSAAYRVGIPKINQFYHLGRFLKEAVHKYGTAIKDGDIKTFYHGISEQLLFPEIIGSDQRGISIYCPLSTSDVFDVALSFSDMRDGLIVQFVGGKDANAKYFSMSWLSDYTSESEHFYIQTHHPLHIDDVVHISSGTRLGMIVKVLRLMEHITTGKRCNKGVSSHALRLVSDIIQNQLSIGKEHEYPSCSYLHTYAKKLINQYFHNKTSIILDYKDINQPKYMFLARLLFHSHFEWIHIELIQILYPQIGYIVIRNVNVIDVTLKNILYHLRLLSNSSQITKIKILGSHYTATAFLYEQEFRDIGFEISRDDKNWFSICKTEQNEKYYVEEKDDDVIPINTSLNDTFILQLSYALAFGIKKPYFKLMLGLENMVDYSTLCSLVMIVIAYIHQKYDQQETLSPHLRTFIESTTQISSVFDACTKVLGNWSLDLVLEKCQKISNFVLLNDLMVEDINTSLEPTVVTSDANIVSIDGHAISERLECEQTHLQMVYWKYEILYSTKPIRKIERINLSDHFEFQYLICCLLLRMYSSWAERLSPEVTIESNLTNSPHQAFNDDQKHMEQILANTPKEIQLTNQFILQLTYSIAFCMESNLEDTLQINDHIAVSTLFMLSEITKEYMECKYDDEPINPYLGAFIKARPELLSLYTSPKIEWFDLNVAMRLCLRICSVVDLSESVVLNNINTVLHPNIVINERGIVSINGYDISMFHDLMRIELQLIYSRYAMLQNQAAITKIQAIDLSDDFQFQYLICCLQLKKFTNYAKQTVLHRMDLNKPSLC